ncbi:MAG: dipeptidyl-peptidase IV [Clostridium butyricum]|nr:dipeptidyl-peptidase IV [Clostridium butyricum]
MKMFRKFIVWAILSVILQFAGLYVLENTIFKNTSEFKSEDLNLNKDKTENINGTIPNSAEQIAISYNGEYLTYVQDDKLFVEEAETGTTNEVVTKDNGQIMYHKWLADRNRLIIAEKIVKEGTEVIQLITYDPRDNSEIVVRTICNYQENMQINKISASVFTGVYYIDVYKGSMKSVLYRIDRNDALNRVDVRADVLGNMEVIPREDRLIYEDRINNRFYITNPSNRLEFNSNKNLALLGIDKEGIVYVGELDGEKVSSITYGKVEEDTSSWDKIELNDVVNKNDLYFNEKSEILINHNLEGKVKNLMTGKEIEYEGKLIEIKEDFISTVDSSGKLKYINLEEEEK